MHCFTPCVIRKPHRWTCNNLIWKLMLCKFKLSHDAAEPTKNICEKSQDTVDYSRVTRWFKKFYFACKILNNQARSRQPKIVDSKAIEPNLVSSTQSVRKAWHLRVQLCSSPSQPQQKAFRAAVFCFMLPKYYKTFDSPKHFAFKNNNTYKSLNTWQFI